QALLHLAGVRAFIDPCRLDPFRRPFRDLAQAARQLSFYVRALHDSSGASISPTEKAVNRITFVQSERDAIHPHMVEVLPQHDGRWRFRREAGPVAGAFSARRSRIGMYRAAIPTSFLVREATRVAVGPLIVMTCLVLKTGLAPTTYDGKAASALLGL